MSLLLKLIVLAAKRKDVLISERKTHCRIVKQFAFNTHYSNSPFVSLSSFFHTISRRRRLPWKSWIYCFCFLFSPCFHTEPIYPRGYHYSGRTSRMGISIYIRKWGNVSIRLFACLLRSNPPSHLSRIYICSALVFTARMKCFPVLLSLASISSYFCLVSFLLLGIRTVNATHAAEAERIWIRKASNCCCLQKIFFFISKYAPFYSTVVQFHILH